MTVASRYKTQIDEIRKRLNKSDDHDGDHIDELKDRLSSVRSSLLRKQETIESQKQEIETLREDNGQLSDLLGQALSALNAQPDGGLREVVREFDSQISGLLGDNGPPPADAGGDPPKAEAELSQDPPKAEAEPSAPSSERGDGRQDPRSNEVEAAWQPETESPALKRIMGRRRR